MLSNLFKIEEDDVVQEKPCCPICKGTGYDPEKKEKVYLVNFDFYTDRKMKCICNK